MTPYELFDIGLSVGNRVDVQWGLFITVHLALLGGVIYVDRPLRLPEKAGAMVIYTSFAFLNYRVLRVQMDLLQTTFRQIAALKGDECCLESLLVEYVAADVASGRFALAVETLIGGHILMAVVVTTAIIFDKAVGAKSHLTRASLNEEALKE